MMLDQKTISILTKLHYTPEHLSHLESDLDALSRTFGLLELLRRATDKETIKPYVLTELKKIRISLDASIFADNHHLKQARSEYYTFQKMKNAG